MSALSDYSENKINDMILGITDWTIPASVYVALHDGVPDEDASPSNEVVAAWYARKQPTLGWNAADTVTPANGATNNGPITFPIITGSPVTLSHVSIWDALSGGNMLWYIAFDSPRPFAIGSEPSILDQALQITAGGAYSNYAIPKLIDHLLGLTAYPFVSGNKYLALANTSLTAANITANEVQAASYARELAAFTASVNGQSPNTDLEDFGTAAENWGNIAHFGVYDALTVGNLICFGALTEAFDVNQNDTASVPAGNIIIEAQ